MKKKRLLAIFAAFAVAATMATGLTACGDNDNNDDGTHTEQPGDENPENPNPDNPGAEYTRITEEEWIKAFEDTVAASSYTITAKETSSLVSDGGETGTFESIEELRDDKVNNTSYNKYEAKGKISEYYSELGEQEIIEYYRDFADGEWTEWDSRSYSAEDLKWTISTLLAHTYNVVGTSVCGTVTELYSYAEFNSKTNLYTLSLLNDGVPATLVIQFKNGYLYRTVGITDKDGNSHINELTITNVNSTVVTVPQEVKDAVGGTETPENPDDEDTGVTKEEWIKAWQDSTSADSYAMDYDGWTFMVSTDEVGNKYYAKMLYDNVNKTTYMQYADSNEESELYAEVVGSNLLQYINSNGEWLSSTLPASNWENGNQLLSYASTVYTVAETTVSGTLAELYDYVKYDASSKTYSVNAAIKDNIVTLKVQLSDGYLYKLFMSVEVDGETYEDKITFTGYNSTVVTVPQEVKDAVGGTGTPENPDEEVSYVGTYKVYSLIFGTTEYFVGDMAPAIGSGEEILLTEDYMVIVLNEDGTAIVSQTVGEFTQDIPCTWEALDVFIMINMNGAVQGFLAEGNTIFTTIFADVTNAVDPLVWTITLIKQ